MSDWANKLDTVVGRLVRAFERLKKAEVEADKHADDFHFDPKYTEALDKGRRSLRRSLDSLERLWNKGA